MKIFDLQCAGGHAFEGWFSSEDDYQDQRQRGLLACPLCSDTDVNRIPSAPRLNLRAQSTPVRKPPRQGGTGQEGGEEVASVPPAALQAAWLQAVRQVMARTEDVGQRFPEEARRMHYGETEERGIRGQATPEQTRDLLEEGIPVMPLPIPDGLKDTLQ